MKSSKNVTLHGGGVLSINAGENWLGIGAADNTMSLFHRPASASASASKTSTWQLYRTPHKTVAMVWYYIHPDCQKYFIVAYKLAFGKLL